MAKKKSAGAKYFGRPVADDPDDAPELLSGFFRDGELREGDRAIRRGRPPLSGKPKTAITRRLDEDVVKAYRETGEGWQTRINADLRRAQIGQDHERNDGTETGRGESRRQGSSGKELASNHVRSVTRLRPMLRDARATSSSA
jgi:hypothetical protein